MVKKEDSHLRRFLLKIHDATSPRRNAAYEPVAKKQLWEDVLEYINGSKEKVFLRFTFGLDDGSDKKLWKKLVKSFECNSRTSIVR